MSQTTAQKVVALRDLADDLHAEIRALRQRAERAEAAIARVRALHAPSMVSGYDPLNRVWTDCCRQCTANDSDFHYPCPTLRALDGDA